MKSDQSYCLFLPYIESFGWHKLAYYNAVGRDPIERLRFLAPGAREGGEKTQPFNWIHSRLFTSGIFVSGRDWKKAVRRERDAAVVVHIWRRSGAWYKGRGALSVAGIRVDGQREERWARATKSLTIFIIVYRATRLYVRGFAHWKMTM